MSAEKQIETLTKTASVIITQTANGYFKAALSSGPESYPCCTPVQAIDSLYYKVPLVGESGNLEVPEAKPLEAKLCSTNESAEIAAAEAMFALSEMAYVPGVEKLVLDLGNEILQSLKLKNSSNKTQ